MSASGCCSKWSVSDWLEFGDLAVELADDPHRGGGGRAERIDDRPRGRLELLGAEGHVLISSTRPSFDVAFPTTAFECGTDLSDRQARTGRDGVGALISTAMQSFRWARSVEPQTSSRVVLP